MNKYYVLVTAVMFGALLIAVLVGLKYSQASLLFGVIAATLAPVAIHKVEGAGAATGLLVGLSFFASFPLKKLFQIDTYSQEVALPAIYLAALWLVGAGWKRSWK